MIVSYQTGMEFLQDNQAYLQTNPYLSSLFTLDAPLLKQADKINYALRCEQGDKRLLALKIEPYNLLLFGEEACVPELLRFLFDGGYEIKNYLCASELGYVLMQKMQSYGRCYEEALAMDFMEAWSITEPSAPEVETAREDDLDKIFDCAQRFVSDCGLLDKPEKEPFRKNFGFVPDHPCRRKDCQHGAHCTGYTTICGSCLSTRGMNTAGRVTHARSSTAPKMRF